MIDSHTHLYDPRFDEDFDEMIQRSIEAGIDRFIVPAADPRDQEKLFNSVSKYPERIYATVGLHPTDVNNNTNYKSDLEFVRNTAYNPPMRLVAIGETGIDLHWSKDFLPQQREAFKFQIELAIELNLPIIIHCREGFHDTFDILEPYAGKIKGVFHSFAGTATEVERIEKIGGFYYGINGTVTYKNSTLPLALESIPLEKLLLETDAPYLPPTPHRGKRNESSYIKITAQKVAEIKGVKTSELDRITTQNTELLFAL